MILLSFFLLCLLYVAACENMIRGGSQQIFSFYFKRIPAPDKIPGAHLVAALATPLYLGPYLNLVIGINGYKLVGVLAIYIVFWFLTIMSAWQGYYSIGGSKGSRRPSVPWIDFVLSHTFGPITFNVARAVAAPGKSVAWWICRDGAGFFLRMCHSFPLFLALELFLHPSARNAMYAFLFPLVFAFGAVLIYAAYNWMPIFTRKSTNSGVNWSEFANGAWLAGLIFLFIALVI